MKQFKMVLIALVAMLSISSLNAQTKSTQVVKAKHQHKEVYQCPMKCEGEKKYSKAGKCPKCNMQLKKVTKSTAVAGTYQCPMKCEGDKFYNQPGKCPKCKMDLKKVKAA